MIHLHRSVLQVALLPEVQSDEDAKENITRIETDYFLQNFKLLPGLKSLRHLHKIGDSKKAKSY
jgi:hypothetical protein